MPRKPSNPTKKLKSIKVGLEDSQDVVASSVASTETPSSSQSFGDNFEIRLRNSLSNRSGEDEAGTGTGSGSIGGCSSAAAAEVPPAVSSASSSSSLFTKYLTASGCDTAAGADGDQQQGQGGDSQAQAQQEDSSARHDEEVASPAVAVNEEVDEGDEIVEVKKDLDLEVPPIKEEGVVNKEESVPEAPPPKKRKYRKRRLRFSKNKLLSNKSHKKATNTKYCVGTVEVKSCRCRVEQAEVMAEQENGGKGERSQSEADEAVKQAHAQGKAQVMSLPSRQRLREYSPLQLLLDYYMRVLQRKDAEEYFWFPVTDEMAPDYAQVIGRPMDFLNMRQKLDRNEYTNFDQFKADVYLICSNGIAYNDEATIYHQAAQKLRHVADQIFSKENLEILNETLPFMGELSADQVGFEVGKKTEQNGKAPTTTSKTNKGKGLAREQFAVELAEDAKRRAGVVRERLSCRPVQSHLAFLNRTADGATTLNMTTGNGTSRKVGTLSDLIGQLKEGNPGLSPYKDCWTNRAVPVTALDYGPYCSFGPSYDSTWANLSLRESQILLSSCDDEEKESVEDAYSLRHFVDRTNKQLIDTVDSIIEAVSGTSHSAEKRESSSASTSRPAASETVDFAALRTLSNLGIDVSFLDNIEASFDGPIERSGGENMAKLKSSMQTLNDLTLLQRQRLSQRPPFTLSYDKDPDLRTPSTLETNLATQAANQLRNVASLSTTPGDVINAEALHSAMGISAPVEDIDMDVLHEFLPGV